MGYLETSKQQAVLFLSEIVWISITCLSAVPLSTNIINSKCKCLFHLSHLFTLSHFTFFVPLSRVLLWRQSVVNNSVCIYCPECSISHQNLFVIFNRVPVYSLTAYNNVQFTKLNTHLSVFLKCSQNTNTTQNIFKTLDRRVSMLQCLLAFASGWKDLSPTTTTTQ